MSRAAAVGAVSAPAISVPVVWDFLGYHFPAGPLVVGILAVVITRCIVFLNTRGHRQVFLDLFVSALCALLTAIWVQGHDLDLLAADVSGIGIASQGIGIIGSPRALLLGGSRPR